MEKNLKHKVEKKETKIDVKRQRSENWCEVDKELLKELVKKRVKEIENKNTDTNTNQTKKKAWVDLEKDFNSLCAGKSRTITQLRSQWMTIKMTAKKEVSEFRAQSKQTGGGQQPTEVPLSGNDLTVWLPNEFIVDENEYDCDSSNTKEYDEEKVLEILVEAPLESETVKDKSQEGTANQKVTPCKKKNGRLKNGVSEENILKITEHEIECRQELHQLQIEVEKKRIKNLELKYELLQEKLKFYKRKSSDSSNI